MLREYELGSEAIDYIRAELSHTWMLGASLRTLDLSIGRAVAGLPPGVSDDFLSDFESGGVASGEENGWLSDFIGSYLEPGSPRRICLFEDPVARRTDPSVEMANAFTVDEHVFRFVLQGTPFEDVVKIAREVHWYPAVGLLATLPEDHPAPEPGSAQPASLVDALAARAEHLIVGAYDAEAWLIWSRPT